MTPEEHRTRIDKKNQILINAYHRLFETKDGKAVLEDLRVAFGMDRPAFIPLEQGSGRIAYDVNHAAIRDGQRSVMLHIQMKLASPCKGDANQEEPKIKVRK